MIEKITWTHVDRYVRDAHDKRGMLPMGPTDADCALAYIKWLERTLAQKEQTVAVRTELLENTRKQLAGAKAASLEKSKQRIADLEEAVALLQQQIKLAVPEELSCRECLRPREGGYQFCKDHMRL